MVTIKEFDPQKDVHEFDDMNECEAGWYLRGEVVSPSTTGAEYYDPAKDMDTTCWLCGKDRESVIHKTA
jgi:hypothetical protein